MGDIVPPEVKSHPTRGGWIEIAKDRRTLKEFGSHPTRGGWIEISLEGSASLSFFVPPHKGWVD